MLYTYLSNYNGEIMSKVIANIRGTTSEAFSIGKRGISVISGTTEPLNSVGSFGDIYVLKGTNPKFYQKHSIWMEIGCSSVHIIDQNSMFEAVFPNEVLLVDSSDGGVTVELTSSSAVKGYTITIKDMKGTGNITIVTEGNEKIDGNSSLIIDSGYGRATLVSDGSDFYVI